MNKIKSIIIEEISNVTEFWALFAHIYENYFQHLKTEDEINNMIMKLTSQTNDSRIIRAIHYFGEMQKNEI